MNMTLAGMEALLREHYPSNTRRGRKAQVHIVIYADDFIITGSTPELRENEIKPLVATFLQQRGLELSPEKTRVTQIENGFDFLGHNVRKYNGKLLIKPSTQSVKALLDTSPRRHQDTQASHSRRLDRATQSHHQGMGQLPMSRGKQTRLQSGGSRNLQDVVAMGNQKTSYQSQTVGGEEILSPFRPREMDVLRTRS